MAKKQGEKKSNGPSKSFMTVGPTLHYSHANVRRCWALAVVVFWAVCFFWSKILTGTPPTLDFEALLNPASWGLGQFIISPLSIYEYPWQILVLGLLMGILGVGPVIVSQLLSFRYSLLMILGVVFIAKLPLFGVFLLVSCIAVACRPLRFRSRFIAIALCMAPQLIYWAVFGVRGTPYGGAQSVDPIRLGISFAPWICAWLTGLLIAGVVIGIGHFTRYRPGLVWIVLAIELGAAFFVFESKISFAELDYQLYVAGNNPEEVPQFHDHNMTKAIDDAMKDPGTRSFLTGLFYPAEPILLREELKNEICQQLSYDRWPSWFDVPEELNYQRKRQWLVGQYDLFINKRPKSKRMPIALYYKAILNEYKPDIRRLGQTEILHFYKDYPQTLAIWHKLFKEFPQSGESLEARWRIAMYLAGLGEFDKSIQYCEVAENLLEKHLELLEEKQTEPETFLTAFSRPAETLMTTYKLTELHIKLQKLESLIGGQNHNKAEESKKRLARFVILNPYGREYAARLDEIAGQMKNDDQLRDNILLAKILLINDTQLKAEQLKELSDKFADTDGGIQALYELGMLKVRLWRDAQTKEDEKKTYLAEAKAILTRFCEHRPESVQSKETRKMLQGLPEAE